eukprot:GHVH01013037.1.p1 GENE.GHVH01013037.1~~GHVH01013037.1.p1  ORF type:complete len:111 (-),score=8.19 GHVH01013037.1:168-500(-)
MMFSRLNPLPNEEDNCDDDATVSVFAAVASHAAPTPSSATDLEAARASSAAARASPATILSIFCDTAQIFVMLGVLGYIILQPGIPDLIKLACFVVAVIALIYWFLERKK